MSRSAIHKARGAGRCAALALAAGILLLASCSKSPEPITDCTPAAGMTPICGLQNPEDMVALGGGLLLLSQMGNFLEPESSGNLALLDSVTGARRVLHPSAWPEPGWGDPSCAALPYDWLSPHGIHLSRRPDGRRQLLVVNHGRRESVEWYEVLRTSSSNPLRRAELRWRGCVLGPAENAHLNDVAATPEGGFVVSHMQDMHQPQWKWIVNALLRLETGQVWEWHPATGYRPLPGTRGTLPNGVQLSLDGEHLFLNLYGENKLRKVRRSDGQILAEVKLVHADNSTWTPEGKLLVASHTAPMSHLSTCLELEEGACGFEFALVSVAPDTLETETIFRHRGAPMGGVTVALQTEGQIWMGSFAGDRVAYIRIPSHRRQAGEEKKP